MSCRPERCRGTRPSWAAFWIVAVSAFVFGVWAAQHAPSAQPEAATCAPEAAPITKLKQCMDLWEEAEAEVSSVWHF